MTRPLPAPEGGLRRRALLGSAMGLLLDGCSSSPGVGSGRRPETAASATTPARAAAISSRAAMPGIAESPGAAAAALPPSTRYRTLPGEVEPACKQTAVRALTAALTWAPGESAGAVRARLTAAGAAPGIAADLAPLMADYLASGLQVVYPQYGGLGPQLRDASVMLVARQVWRPTRGAGLSDRQLTVEVLLTRPGTQWTVGSVNVPQLPSAAARTPRTSERLLSNRRVTIPDAAVADLRAGEIDARLVELLLQLSRRWRLHVQVLKSGHPTHVYGTRRISNHARGRAVDLWAVDDVPVIALPRIVWTAVMREAARLGADEVGGPDAVGPAGRPPFFTNAVHKDHIHIGFDTAGTN